MALLLCAATARELAASVPSLFPDANALPELQPMRGMLKHGEALFLVTGVGPINTALSLGLALGLTHPDGGNHIPIEAILYVGVAGAFDLDITPLCSICHVSTEIWPEYGLNDGTSVTAAAFSFPQWVKPDNESVYDRISLAQVEAIPYARTKGLSWSSCNSLTVAGVTASFVRRDYLWNAWHVELENMEGFAAAYTGARADVPVVEIRVVANKVGPRARHEKDFDGALLTLGKILPALDLI